MGQPRRAVIPSLVLYTMGMPGTYHSICVTRGGGRPTLPRWCTTSSHDDILDYRRDGTTDWLIACVTPELRCLMLGGDLAVA